MANSCEFEFLEYIKEDSIDPHLICSICHKPLKEPVCTSCDHAFGRECITHWLTDSGKYSCPMCLKQPLLIKDLTPVGGPLRMMLDTLQVQCTLCKQIGLQRGNFAEHMKRFCPKATVQCQAIDIKCPWIGLREELQNHVSTCVFEPLRPVLATLIAENQRLISQVQKHENEIIKLTKEMSKMSNTTTHDSDDESDASSTFELPVHGDNQIEENAIFIKSLPGFVKFGDIFDIFSKSGRIKFNETTKKPDIFIFNNPTNKDGFRTAKVYYEDKKSASAAVAEFNNKHIPPWNTHLKVSISERRNRNLKNTGKFNNEGNAGVRHEAKAMKDSDKASNKGETISSTVEQRQSPIEENVAGAKKIDSLRGPRPNRQNAKPTD